MRRFPGFTWVPVTKAGRRKPDGSVRIQKFVRFTGFPSVNGRFLTAEQLLTVDPTTVDSPRERSGNRVVYATDWRPARNAKRAARRDDMFV
ncbi:MAG: hypothetical protein AAB633_01045 [Patescibacteria group bacterium]